jgi:hypothetical protein
MLFVTKNTLYLLKEWGKPSNPYSSKKLQAISLIFIKGVLPQTKSRIIPGHVIYNVQNTPILGINNNYYPFLDDIMKKVNENITIANSRIDFYQIKDNVKDENGKAKHIYSIAKYTTATVENVHALLRDVYSGMQDSNYETDPTNKEDYENLFQFDGKKGETFDYFVARTQIEIKIKGNNTINKTVTWHLIGFDTSLCVENDLFAKEFGILPMSPTFGNTGEIIL